MSGPGTGGGYGSGSGDGGIGSGSGTGGWGSGSGAGGTGSLGRGVGPGDGGGSTERCRPGDVRESSGLCEPSTRCRTSAIRTLRTSWARACVRCVRLGSVVELISASFAAHTQGAPSTTDLSPARAVTCALARDPRREPRDVPPFRRSPHPRQHRRRRRTTGTEPAGQREDQTIRQRSPKSATLHRQVVTERRGRPARTRRQDTRLGSVGQVDRLAMVPADDHGGHS